MAFISSLSLPLPLIMREKHGICLVVSSSVKVSKILVTSLENQLLWTLNHTKSHSWIRLNQWPYPPPLADGKRDAIWSNTKHNTWFIYLSFGSYTFSETHKIIIGIDWWNWQEIKYVDNNNSSQNKENTSLCPNINYCDVGLRKMCSRSMAVISFLFNDFYFVFFFHGLLYKAKAI